MLYRILTTDGIPSRTTLRAKIPPSTFGLRFLMLVIFFSTLFSCSSENKNAAQSVDGNKTDTLEIIRSFIYGLWSEDSGNVLSNDGYYFKPDGSLNFVAAEATGSWELMKKDSLKITYHSYNEDFSSFFKIDSVTDGRMILTGKEGRNLLRKVPFGMNNEGIVLQGFMGKLQSGEEKEYSFDIPASKKMELKLKCENKNVGFNIYDGDNLITSAPLQNWTAIMIRSGKYKVVVSNSSAKSVKDAAQFDLKVIGY